VKLGVTAISQRATEGPRESQRIISNHKGMHFILLNISQEIAKLQKILFEYD